MKSKLLIASLLLGTVLAAIAAKDPVLMKINGKEIKLSEFEYLYNKNRQQQVEPETLDQYVERFITYKRKVADAEAAGIDTLKSFQNELETYRDDIIKPFLEDTTVKARLVAEAYDHMKRDVDIDHFMWNIGTDYQDNQKQMQFVDSLRNRILAGESWDSIAIKYSIDQSVRQNSGHYGFIRAGVFPYEFEQEVWNTPVGQVSKPFRTDYGIHMIRVNGEQPAKEVHVLHILKTFKENPRTPGEVTDSMKAVARERIDKVYAELKNGKDFAELAKSESQDPGSARNGGDLNWFGAGRMVKPFEKVAFSLPVGEISEPFETAFGYHIIKKVDERSAPDFETAKKSIEAKIRSDKRSQMPRTERVKQVKEFYKYTPNTQALREYLSKELAKHGQYDSAFVADVVAKSDFPIATFDKKQTITLKEIAKRINPKAKLNNESAVGYIESVVDPYADTRIMDYYKDNLFRDNKDFRNLLNEYRDGMLLFEISNRKVWDGASRDTTGLEAYFEANRSKYTWDAPRFKGIILSAKSDSVMNIVNTELAQLRAEALPLDTITSRLHKKHTSEIKMERMLMAKGENPMVDHLLFNAPAPQGNYPVGMILEGGLIPQPEELADVRGQVTSDYQDVLERRWVESLEKKYPVTIDKKVLKKVKRNK